jgi:hypothetical protein
MKKQDVIKAFQKVEKLIESGRWVLTENIRTFQIQALDEVKKELGIHYMRVYWKSSKPPLNISSKKDCKDCKNGSDGVPDCVIDGECPDNKNLTAQVCFNYACEDLDKDKDICKREKCCDMQIPNQK